MEKDVFACFSTAELIDAIDTFGKIKMKLVKERAIIAGEGDISVLSEQQINVVSCFLERVCEKWKNPIEELALKKNIKNKYKNFFLFRFSSFCSTQEESLINLVTRKIVFLKEERITVLTRENGVDINFFVENGRIKARILTKPKLKNFLSLQELKSFKVQKNIFFLDENLA